MDGLELIPCLPASWNEAKVVKPFRDCIYNITYKRTGNKRITVDGEVIDSNVLPLKKGSVEVICEI